MMEKKTALYCRVSTGNQSKGLQAQIHALREHCSHKGIKNFIIYEDENISGTKDSRPALNKMMKDVKEGMIDKVICYSFSRYARSTTHLLKALQTFKELGVGFTSLTEQIDTDSPLGVAIFTILGSISQLERDLIAERVKNGLNAARARGVQLGRKKTRPSNLIRTLRQSGMTYSKIAKIAKCSTGAVAKEIAEWKKEIEHDGKDILSSSSDIPEVIIGNNQHDSQNLSSVLELEPLEIVRF